MVWLGHAEKLRGGREREGEEEEEGEREEEEEEGEEEEEERSFGFCCLFLLRVESRLMEDVLIQ